VVPALAALLLAHVAGAASDQRTFSRVVQRADSPRVVSVQAELGPGEGSSEAAATPLWPGLSLRLVPMGHAGVERGVFAYVVQLLSDTRGGAPVPPTDQPGHGITADVVAAFHFRNRDNSGPNAPGPLNVNAPGEFRVVRYPGVTLEIRVLSFEILGADPGVTPSFGSLRLLVTAREEHPAARDLW